MPSQDLKTKYSGFTLVEIMIVILIIIMLTQLGNIGSLFRQKEKSQLEETGIHVLNFIDREKVDALLGKTKDGEIVRKRTIMIQKDPTNTHINLTSTLNLVKNPDTDPETPNASTSLTVPGGLSMSLFGCPGTGADTSLGTQLSLSEFFVTFEGDNISFRDISTPKVVILLSSKNNAQEIHIDRRTGLTYQRSGTIGQVTCN